MNTRYVSFTVFVGRLLRRQNVSYSMERRKRNIREKFWREWDAKLTSNNGTKRRAMKKEHENTRCARGSHFFCSRRRFSRQISLIFFRFSEYFRCSRWDSWHCRWSRFTIPKLLRRLFSRSRFPFATETTFPSFWQMQIVILRFGIAQILRSRSQSTFFGSFGEQRKEFNDKYTTKFHCSSGAQTSTSTCATERNREASAIPSYDFVFTAR